MKTERNDVGFLLWRKKVDKSLFEHASTPIPNWVGKMGNISRHFPSSNSRNDPQSQVSIKFGSQSYRGWITASKRSSGGKTAFVRLWFDEKLKHRLRRTFVMSYMRSLEEDLSSPSEADVEQRIPFWEFLDIEFDHKTKGFRFEAYYRQGASFPNLFDRLVGSPNLERVSDELQGKSNRRILKQDWKAREHYRFEVGAHNAIYLLADSHKKHLYVGEAGNLIRRLDQGHPSIPLWDRFRYDVLPDALAPFRVQIERMLIRYLAALMPNGRNILHLGITEFRLINDKVDR